MSEPTLFDMPGEPPPLEPGMSPDRRRTQKQRQALDSGKHPMSVFLGLTLPLSTEAEARCGNCIHQVTVRHDRAWHKCGIGSRMSSSAASDIRLGWPGCIDWQPRGETAPRIAFRWPSEYRPEVAP